MARKLPVLSALLALSVLTSLPLSAAAADRPDLRLTEFTVDQVRSVSTPLRLRIAIMMKNYGEPTGEAAYITRLSYRQKRSDPWQTLEEWEGHPLAHRGGARYEQVFDLPLTGRVSLTFQAELDAGGSVEESAEGNNRRTLTRTFYAGVPDLAVENLEAGLAGVTSGGTWKAQVEFDVANLGTGRAEGSFVTVLKVSKSGGGYTELARWKISNMAPGGKRHYRKRASFTDVESLKFFVSVDADNAVMEKETANNTEYSDLVEPEEREEGD